MSQSTLDDDELFGEAANEMRADVEDALGDARAELPAASDVWDVEADNTLGVLNGLKGALDTGDAADHLRTAKKWYTMGERADAFDDADDLADQIDAIESVLDDVADAHDQVGDLAKTIPGLKGTLDDLDDLETEADGDADDGDEADADDAEPEAVEAEEEEEEEEEE